MTDYHAELVSNAQFMVDNQPHCEYDEIRPLPVYTKSQLLALWAAGRKFVGDCSLMMKQLCYMGELFCPMLPAFDYADGDGNTTDIFDNPALTHFTDINEVHGGTFIGYIEGPDPDTQPAHVCMAMEAGGPDLTVFNFGDINEPVLRPLDVEDSVHPGQQRIFMSPIGLFPPPAKTYNYEFYDATEIDDLPHGKNSERAIVEKYDVLRADLTRNHAALLELEEDLAVLHTRAENNLKKDGPGNHLEWRIPRLRTRSIGGIVDPT